MILLTPLFSGCDNSKIKVLGSFSKFTDSVNNFIEGDEQTLDDLFSLKIPFAVYLTDEGCSHCESFKPIINDFMLHSNMAVVRFQYEDAIKVNTKYNSLFSQINSSGKKILAFPTFGVASNETTFEYLNNSKYMQTKYAFKNQVEKLYKSSTIYFTEDDVLTKSINEVCTYISYENSNEENVILYVDKLLPKITQSSHKIVVSNCNATSLEVSFLKNNEQNKNYLSDSLVITSAILEDSFNKYF